jgi:hypothetical protein
VNIELVKEQFTRYEDESRCYKYVNERRSDYLISRFVETGLSSGWVCDCYRMNIYNDENKKSWISVPITILEAAEAFNATHTGTKELPVIQFYSDEWIWFKDGSWREMTVEEQIEWSHVN